MKGQTREGQEGSGPDSCLRRVCHTSYLPTSTTPPPVPNDPARLSRCCPRGVRGQEDPTVLSFGMVPCPKIPVAWPYKGPLSEDTARV